MSGRSDKFRAIDQVRISPRHAKLAQLGQGESKECVPPSLATDKAGKLWAYGRVLREREVGIKDKHTIRWVRGLGIKVDIPDARCAILWQPNIALSRGSLMEGSRGGMRANQRRQLDSRDAFVLKQRE